ncbi:hypothetical protein BGZ63DRAFT_372941 [Mariannaea sp. PMI_226]|nr:hypothetical protein BGZ63DRAFT_372941 [Mariannaea sp. PMI_226]
MDPLSAGASVLAFFGILNSLQQIYKTLSSVKDGPQNIRLAANSVDQLRSILTEIQQKQCLNDPDGRLLLKKCAEDVGSVAAKLAKLRITPTESRGGKMWKRIKAALSESDLDHMRQVLSGHSAALGLRLIVLQRDVLVECRDEILSLKSNVANQQGTQRATPSHNIASCPNSEARMDTMMQMLRDLQAQISVQATSRPAVIEPSENLAEDPQDVRSQLNDAINELCLLISNRKGIIRVNDAEEIIKKVENLTCFAKSDELRYCSEGTEDQSLHRGELAQDLKRISRHLMSSSRFSMNGRVQKTRPGGENIHSRRQQWTVDIRTGQLQLSIRKMKHLLRESDDSRNLSGEEAEDFSATLAFFPSKKSIHKTMLVVDFHHSERMYGDLLTIPRICVNTIQPNDAKVFEFVLKGNLEGLRKCLAEGDASIRDHDEDGMSLLFHAMDQPDICKFLVESGLDVDHLTQTVCGLSSITPLRYAIPISGKRDELQRINQCRTVLLEAGADPLLGFDSGGYENHAFRGVLDSGHAAESIAVFLNHGWPFINIETLVNGATPLLHIIGGYEHGLSLDCISMLLRRNANVHAVDKNGMSCLHRAIFSAQGPYCLVEEFKVLALLVKSGANVHHVDKRGVSVSEAAYEKKLSSDHWGNWIGSYWGDIWDAVLAACGYQVSDFRQRHPRTAQYTCTYPRSLFKIIWKEYEDLCPYWDEDEATYRSDSKGHPCHSDMCHWSEYVEDEGELDDGALEANRSLDSGSGNQETDVDDEDGGVCIESSDTDDEVGSEHGSWSASLPLHTGSKFNVS